MVCGGPKINFQAFKIHAPSILSGKLSGLVTALELDSGDPLHVHSAVSKSGSDLLAPPHGSELRGDVGGIFVVALKSHSARIQFVR
jgi:hypothetical protein